MKTQIESTIKTTELEMINYTINDLRDCKTLNSVKALFSLTFYRNHKLLEFGWGSNHAFVSRVNGGERILFITE